MKHTTHYRITVNYIEKIITLDKPLSEAAFFKAPRVYCEKEDPKTHALIHYGKCSEEHYFRNYEHTIAFFNKCQNSNYFNGYLFNNIFEEN